MSTRLASQNAATSGDNRKTLGQRGEVAVAQVCKRLNYQVLAKNWRCRYGELDLIIKDGDTIAAVEVKTRSVAGFGHPLTAITQAKVYRLRKLLSIWVAREKPGIKNLRIDAAAVLFRDESLVKVEYLKGVDSVY